MATRKKKNNIEAFGHPIYGKRFAKYGEMRPSGSSEIPNDLEEAADEYDKKHTYQRYDGGGLTPEYNATLAEAFIAGAKWDREQMMKGAVEMEVGLFSKFLPMLLVTKPVELKDFPAKFGDKVRIIIVKEN